MSTYDTYGYLNVQIKNRAKGKNYSIGDYTPLSTGIHFGLEGAVLVRAREVVGIIPYDQMWDKWGGWIGAEFKKTVEANNPVKQAIDNLPDNLKMTMSERRAAFASALAKSTLKQIMKTVAEVEAEMKGFPMQPYWMVHRRGKQSGPATQVQHSAEAAFKEAERLAKKEMDSFTVLQAVGRVKPVDVVVEVESVYRGDAGDIPDALPRHIGAEPGDQQEACACCDPVSGFNWEAIKKEAKKYKPNYLVSCGCRGCANAREQAITALSAFG